MSNSYPPVVDFFLIAKALKSHGTGGKLRLAIENQFKSYIRKDNFLFFDINGSKDAAHFIVGLEDVNNKKDSDVLSGSNIWLPIDKVKSRHQRSPRNLKDKWDQYVIVDLNTGQRYKILRIEEYPQQLMAVILIDEKEKLIPLSEQLITLLDKENKIIEMEIPEGLLDL